MVETNTLSSASVSENNFAEFSLKVRIATLTAVLLPLAGFVAAIVSIWGWGFGWIEFSLLTGMYVLTVLGITVGFHRLFTHKAFETYSFIKYLLAIFGSMAVEGSLLKWVAVHRRHHQFSDMADDPHSPHNHGNSVRDILRGAWHAHIGWFFEPDPSDLARYTKDLSRDKVLVKIDDLFPLWIIMGLVIPAVLGGLMHGSWEGALSGLLWGGFARAFLVHHVTWSINSICHIWGSRPFNTSDRSRNNFLFGIFALGEGWHNNHHAFPSSARHGLKWWQFDLSYEVIRLLKLLKLVWKVNLPSNKAAYKTQGTFISEAL